MKELYLTVTDLTFATPQGVLARGRAITRTWEPAPQGALEQLLAKGTVQLGALDREDLSGCWPAALEGLPGCSVTFSAGRFLLSLPVRSAASHPEPAWASLPR